MFCSCCIEGWTGSRAILQHKSQTRDENASSSSAASTHVHCTKTETEESIGPGRLAGRWHPDRSVPRRVRERGDDALDLQVLVHGGEPLVPAEAAHLVSAEGRVRVEGEVAVHPHGARAHRPRHPVRDVQALGHDPGGEPVPGAVCLLDHLVDRPGRRNPSTWSLCVGQKLKMRFRMRRT
jgi:hypothetical protein